MIEDRKEGKLTKQQEDMAERLFSLSSTMRYCTPTWVCNNCGNKEDTEREIICWKCGKGEMTYRGPEYNSHNPHINQKPVSPCK